MSMSQLYPYVSHHPKSLSFPCLLHHLHFGTSCSIWNNRLESGYHHLQPNRHCILSQGPRACVRGRSTSQKVQPGEPKAFSTALDRLAILLNSEFALTVVYPSLMSMLGAQYYLHDLTSFHETCGNRLFVGTISSSNASTHRCPRSPIAPETAMGFSLLRRQRYAACFHFKRRGASAGPG
jgi:hypothetical protein